MCSLLIILDAPGLFSDISFKFVWFIYRTSDSEMALFFSSGTLSLKSSLFLWHFVVFGGGKKGCWYSKRVTHPSSLMIHSIVRSTGKTLAPVSGTGAERGRKQCLEFVKKKTSHSHMSNSEWAPPVPKWVAMVLLMCVFMCTKSSNIYIIFNDNVINDLHMKKCWFSLLMHMILHMQIEWKVLYTI